MKRSIFITVGIVIILLVLAVWIYLMLYGTPEKSGDVFSNLGFNVSEQSVVIVESPQNEDPNVFIDTSKERLKQLTTRPVAGFISTQSSSTNSVRYAEKGTGHVYEINLVTGEEQLVSRTTIPRVSHAMFSKDGSSVALISTTGYTVDSFVGKIDSNSSAVVGENLPPNSRDVAFRNTDSVLYVRSVPERGLVGYEYTFTTGEQRELFELPFTEARMLWGSETDFVYNKPSAELEGFLYQIQNQTYTPTPYSGYGLNVIKGSTYTGISFAVGGSYKNQFVRDTTKESFVAGRTVLPEKCVFDSFFESIMWCGAPLEILNAKAIDSWRKGSLQLEDFIWKMDIEEGQAVLIGNISELTGRKLDISSIDTSPLGSDLFFTNKIDSTLWQFNISGN